MDVRAELCLFKFQNHKNILSLTSMNNRDLNIDQNNLDYHFGHYHAALRQTSGRAMKSNEDLTECFVFNVSYQFYLFCSSLISIVLLNVSDVPVMRLLCDSTACGSVIKGNAYCVVCLMQVYDLFTTF